MKAKFVRTKNVKNFITLTSKLKSRANGVPGMSLVYGEPGLGKTQAALWWVANNQSEAIYVCAKQSMTVRWLLEEIAKELGDTPSYKTSDLFEQITRELIRNPQIIIVDEIDYLTHEKDSIEMLRDIHDRTHTPIILIGMAMADKRIKRYKHLYDRLSEILHFASFNLDDVKTLIAELAEIKFSEESINFIYQTGNRFRQIVKIIDKAESYAKSNDLDVIQIKDVQNLSR
jgi:DNA transposition AAA+ family ATPase